MVLVHLRTTATRPSCYVAARSRSISRPRPVRRVALSLLTRPRHGSSYSVTARHRIISHGLAAIVHHQSTQPGALRHIQRDSRVAKTASHGANRRDRSIVWTTVAIRLWPWLNIAAGWWLMPWSVLPVVSRLTSRHGRVTVLPTPQPTTHFFCCALLVCRL